MDTSKETVLKELISMCYDIVVEEASKTENPTSFYIKFFREIFKTEIEILKEDYGIEVSGVHHPITAIKKYRILNVKSHEYRFIDEIKPVEVGDGYIQLKQWKCRYLHNCIKHKNPLCIRGIAQGLAIDEFSDGNFTGIHVDFDIEGNCEITLNVDYDADLKEIPQEERVLEDDIYRVLTLDDHMTLSINMWVKGIERGAIAIYGRDGAVTFLKKFYDQLVNKWIEKFFKIDYYIGLPISLWLEGRFVFE